ncbi:threonine-phosphate decarboxylase [Roseobacter sp. SK209-2-6]|uniref:threonine-phosphate decarboxylase n=1 Tax=Roseobacter sp. SK209-2-6 TaxID=388739 RepID=UPI00056970D3|nr:threonine-phosphate decarboxylase [Roseobacter sp. SK209-2-6]
MSEQAADSSASCGAGKRDHGGNLSAAIARFGGEPDDWIDLSTGINPSPYPIPAFTQEDWCALPDASLLADLITAARGFWNIPMEAAVLAAPGASALIAQIPGLVPPGTVCIETPTYNEHAASFQNHGWQVTNQASAQARVAVHPNNPDGRLWTAEELSAPLTIIDESFCDICPEQSLISMAGRPGTLVLKSFGKFWGLAGMRLGFAIGDPDLIQRLADFQGPWGVSGPALKTGIAALNDPNWAMQTRIDLAASAGQLDQLMLAKGAKLAGGTDLFRLYEVEDAAAWQERLAKAHFWSRIFPYSKHFLRLGLPPKGAWSRLEAAL